MDSRILVKGLPLSVKTDDALRQFFEKDGIQITDVRLCKTPTGVSRQFGFIGYKRKEDADNAIKHYNGSYWGQKKLIVEKAIPIGDASARVGAWSKHTPGTSAHARAQNQDGKKPNQQSSRAVPKFEVVHHQNDRAKDDKYQEFLKAAQPRTKEKTWQDSAADNHPQKKRRIEHDEAEDNENSNFEDDQNGADEDEAHYSTRAPGKTKAISNPAVASFMQEKMTDNFDEQLRQIEAEAKVKLPPLKHPQQHEGEETSKNKFKVNTPNQKATPKNNLNNNNTSQQANKNNNTNNNNNLNNNNTNENDETDLSNTGRIWVTNIPFTTTEDELTEIFAPFGSIESVTLPPGRYGNNSGYAFIQFDRPADAINALASLDNVPFQGRILVLKPGRPGPKKKASEADGKELTGFKAEKEQKQKKISENENVWNTLFIRADTVLEATADRMNITKAELLDKDKRSGDLAVRMALAETRIINDTLKFLAENGVSVDKLEKHTGQQITRSTTSFLIKNIPFVTTEEELYDLVSPFGVVSRLLLPESRAIAIIEFLEEKSAKEAFKALRFKRFHDVPLYVEWTPVIFDEKAATPYAPPSKTPVSEPEPTAPSLALPASKLEKVLIVANLNEASTEADIKQLFTRAGFKVARIVLRKRKQAKGGQTNYVGFATVEFATKEDADGALKKCQRQTLHDNAIQLSKNERRDIDEEPAPQIVNKRKYSEIEEDEDKAQSSKLLVKNVPFEATQADLKEFFSAFGKINSLRLPKKFGGGRGAESKSNSNSHRGFAFVEYATKQEAKGAKDATRFTHFLGRKLVVEYAKDDRNNFDAAARNATEMGLNQA